MKVILHLCADIGSDSYPYQCDNNYKVILIGKDYGVENLTKEKLLTDFGVSEVYGIIANPVCTDLSAARSGGKPKDIDSGMFLVNHCRRIIAECNPRFWVIENPATGGLKSVLGKPKFVYQPWEFGSAWTKKTALWGEFNIPQKIYKDFPKQLQIQEMYVRTSRDTKPSLPFQHKSVVKYIKEFEPFIDRVKTDADLRSLCSQKFAKAFYEANK
jgi:hypothetical protein